MKTVQLHQLQEAILHSGKEAITVEFQGKAIGYFYPINDAESVNQAKEELSKTLDQVMQQTGWDEEQLVQALTEGTDL